MNRARLFLALLTYAAAARAEPPQGTDLNSPIHKWWECHVQPHSPVSCCSEADGHNLTDNDWRQTKDPADPYEIRVEGTWHPVPARAILGPDGCGPDPDTSNASSAKVWYIRYNEIDGTVRLSILCFMPGTFY